MRPVALVLLMVVMLVNGRASGQTSTLEQQLIAEPSANIARDAVQIGDASRGAVVFHQPALGCVKCHTSADSESSLGPKLAKWLRSVDDAFLVLSVLDPSAHIEKEYRSTSVLTIDGSIVVGIPVDRIPVDQGSEQTNETNQAGEETPHLMLRVGSEASNIVKIDFDDIEVEKQTSVSLMPSSQVNALQSRKEFLDLIAYLIAIRDGGADTERKLKPTAAMLGRAIPDYESKIDHRGFVEDWSPESFDRGKQIYQRLCINCHGTIDKPGSLPTSIRFASGQFKFGSDPYSIYQTLTHGGGLMLPQTWMVPSQKYDVIHYLREHFLQPHNPTQFTTTSEPYLASLPSGDSRGPEPRVIEPWTTMDYGSMLTNTIEFGDNGSNLAQKAIAIRLDDGPGGVSRGNAFMAFEHDTLRMAGAWTGDFVDWQGIQFNGRHEVHLRCAGKLHASNPTGPGWANPETGQFIDNQRVEGRDGRRYGPLPESWGKFRGLHRHGKQVILRYSVGHTQILERANLLLDSNEPLFTRTLNLQERTRDLDMLVLTRGGEAHLSASGDVAVLGEGVSATTVAIAGFDDQASLQSRDGKLILHFNHGEEPLRGNVVIASGAWDPQDRQSILDELNKRDNDLSALTHGGPPQFATPIAVAAKPWFDSDAWAVDELMRPEGNPWQARTRITGLDFYPGGTSMAVCTWDGDVWRVTGLEGVGNGGTLSWHRVATGLYQPLGILVLHGRLMVTCRDQLVSLGDSNGDGEMDDYRCFNSDHQVTEHFHEFAMGLQRDRAGDFYYAKSARHALKAVVPHHGTLLKVSSDGRLTEIIATGFRAANGVCLNEDGSFIVTDQEGHWNPKNRINWVWPGGFYGNMYGYHDVVDDSDDAMQQPLCWITNQFDRSPAELLWTPEDTWGPMAGRLLNLSYGYGRVYVVPHEHLPITGQRSQPQGGMCQLPIPDLPTGMIRARFNPLDGQLYLGGMFSWAGSRQEQEGGLFRIRWKGNPVDLPIGLQARRGSIRITFTDPLDPQASLDTSRYQIKVWELKRTKEYGSDHFNERELKVDSVTLSNDGKMIRLQIEDLKPTWGMEVSCQLKTAKGIELKRVIHNTVHGLPADGS